MPTARPWRTRNSCRLAEGTRYIVSDFAINLGRKKFRYGTIQQVAINFVRTLAGKKSMGEKRKTEQRGKPKNNLFPWN